MTDCRTPATLASQRAAVLGILASFLLALPARSGAAPPVAIPGRTEYRAEVWDTDRGLPGSAVTAVAQTPDGYLWVGTYDGLVRFDGVKFQSVNRLPAPGFPANAVTTLLVDRQGHLWAGTEHRFACLRDGRWQVFPAAVRPGGFVRGLFEDREGNILASLANRLLRVAHGSLVDVPGPAEATAPLTGLPGSQGDVWAFGSRYFGRYADGRWTSIPLPSDMRERDGPLGAAPSREGGFWLAGAAYLRRYRNGEWGPPVRPPAGFQFHRTVSFLEDAGGNLWVGDYLQGLLQFRKEGGVLRFTRADGLPNLAIRSLFEDREGNIWVGTDGGGVVRFRSRLAKVFDDAQGLNNILVDSVSQESSGPILAGTYGGGLVRFDPAANRFSPPLESPGPEGLNRNDLVLSVQSDPDGTSWAAVYQKGLFRVRERNVEPVAPEQFGRANLTCLFQDSRHTLWIGAASGLASYRDGQLTRYGELAGLPAGGIVAIAEDRSGGLWVGGAAGLFQGHDGRFRKFSPPRLGTYGPITALYTDREGTLWVAVTGGGVDRLRNGAWNSYRPSQGLPAATIGSILEDAEDRLWLATRTQGLWCIARSSFDSIGAGRQARLDALALQIEDGLSTNQFRVGYQPAAWKAGDGRLWFATLKGVAMVDPVKVHRTPWAPPVLIQDVLIDGRRLLPDPSAPGERTVQAGSHRIQFAYTALSYTAPERIRFQYRLDGLDADWVDTPERSATFADLKPGRYVFHVRAANSPGQWSSREAALAIRRLPFLWETALFRILAGAMLMVLTAGAVYGTQHRKLRHKTEQLEKEQALRRDIERMQAVLQVSEERFSKAFGASPFPMAIATASEGRLVEVNGSFIERTGYQRAEVVGHLWNEKEIWTDLEERSRFDAIMRRDGRVRALEAHIHDRKGQTRCHLLWA